MKIAFDIGGVLSKFPVEFQIMIRALSLSSEIECYVMTDMHDKPKVVAMLAENGFGMIPEERIYTSDYNTHGEMCKAILCQELGIDVLIDDFIGYVAPEGAPMRLLMMPDAYKPYWHDNWKVSEGDGDFGRRKAVRK